MISSRFYVIVLNYLGVDVHSSDIAKTSGSRMKLNKLRAAYTPAVWANYFPFQRLWECFTNYWKLSLFGCRYSRIICTPWVPRLFNVSLIFERKFVFESSVYYFNVKPLLQRYFEQLRHKFYRPWKDTKVWGTLSGAHLPVGMFI